jgi:HPt (histidine-containing phosphotransfer) domain-containing protein
MHAESLVDDQILQMLRELRTPGAADDPVTEILQVFATDGELVLDRLERAARGADAGEVVAAAHRFKGAAANVGAASLAAHLARIERQGRDGTVEPGDVEAVRPLFQRTLEVLATYLEP